MGFMFLLKKSNRVDFGWVWDLGSSFFVKFAMLSFSLKSSMASMFLLNN